MIHEAVAAGLCRADQVYPVSEDICIDFKALRARLATSDWSNWQQQACSEVLNALNMLDDLAISLGLTEMTQAFVQDPELSLLCDDALIHRSVDWLMPEYEGADLTGFDTQRIISFVDSARAEILSRTQCIDA